jgi:hypothetical protein
MFHLHHDRKDGALALVAKVMVECEKHMRPSRAEDEDE